jgi:hypothetical protein
METHQDQWRTINVPELGVFVRAGDRFQRCVVEGAGRGGSRRRGDRGDNRHHPPPDTLL